MSQILSFQEIQQQYDGEWLIIAYTELDEDLQVVAGEVLAHSPDEAEIYQALPIAKERDVAIEYIGQVPKDLAFML
jgi:hypothetical protein